MLSVGQKLYIEYCGDYDYKDPEEVTVVYSGKRFSVIKNSDDDSFFINNHNLGVQLDCGMVGQCWVCKEDYDLSIGWKRLIADMKKIDVKNITSGMIDSIREIIKS